MSCQKQLNYYQKGHNFLIGRTYLTDCDGCQNYLVFSPMLLTGY